MPRARGDDKAGTSSSAGEPLERHAETSWRDVTVRRYRWYTRVSSLVGTIVFAVGLWQLVSFRLVLGLALIFVGSVLALWTTLLRIDGSPAPLYKPGAGRDERWTPRVVHFYTRQNCALCDEARTRLVHDLEGRHVTIVDHDVDADVALQRRYGDRVPVAVYQGGEVFALAYDEQAVRALT